MTQGEPLIRCEGLTKHFPITRGALIQRQVGAVQAVDEVSLAIQRGETLGLVGESGSGKSTLGRTILLLYVPTFGKVYFDGKDLIELSDGDLRRERKRFQMVFQDPYASLNPRLQRARTDLGATSRAWGRNRGVAPGEGARAPRARAIGCSLRRPFPA